MKPYLEYLSNIMQYGVDKTDRTGTGQRELIGQQMRFDLSAGFPMVTTKKLHLKSIIHELIWFLKGETNIRYLKEHGVSIWDEWADENGDLGPVYGDQWINWEDIRVISVDSASLDLWINQRGYEVLHFSDNLKDTTIGRLVVRKRFNQIQQVIDRIKTNPDCRRLIVSAWNVGKIQDMKLPACHAFFQFYTAPLSLQERFQLYLKKVDDVSVEITEQFLDEQGIPKFRLSCQLYQRKQHCALVA